MSHISLFADQSVDSIKARAIDQGQIRRIDNKITNKETKLENTLSDLKIKDNTAIMIEVKDPGEVDEDC